MYTRFKSQKSGLKLGINSISNSSSAPRSRVVPTSTSSLSTSSTAATTATTISSTGASSTTVSLTPSSSTQSLNATSNTIDPIILNADFDFIINTDESHHLIPVSNNAATSNDKIKATTTLLSNLNRTKSMSNSCSSKSKKNKESQSEQKNVIQIVENIDEPIDLNCISYVKSKWEKYESEIGTEKGPLRHVDQNEQYPHLNGFVAFDMEHWWTERAISCMINETPSPPKTVTTKNPSNENDLTSVLRNDEAKNMIKIEKNFLLNKNGTLKHNTFSLFSSTSNSINSNSKFMNSFNNSTSFNNLHQGLRNFQMCFS